MRDKSALTMLMESSPEIVSKPPALAQLKPPIQSDSDVSHHDNGTLKLEVANHYQTAYNNALNAIKKDIFTPQTTNIITSIDIVSFSDVEKTETSTSPTPQQIVKDQLVLLERGTFANPYTY